MRVTLLLKSDDPANVKPTQVTFTGEYEYDIADGALSFQSEVEGETDYVFNFDHVLYFQWSEQ